jgi:hypothetical protein
MSHTPSPIDSLRDILINEIDPALLDDFGLPC